MHACVTQSQWNRHKAQLTNAEWCLGWMMGIFSFIFQPINSRSSRTTLWTITSGWNLKWGRWSGEATGNVKQSASRTATALLSTSSRYSETKWPTFFHDHIIKWKHFPPYGPLWGESTDHWWIPLTKASNVEIWCVLWCMPEQMVDQTVERLVILDAVVLIMTSL